MQGSFLEWRASSSPSWGPLAERMRCTRARFKLCLWWSKAHEEELRVQALATQVGDSDAAGFWHGLRAVPRLTSSPYV